MDQTVLRDRVLENLMMLPAHEIELGELAVIIKVCYEHVCETLHTCNALPPYPVRLQLSIVVTWRAHRNTVVAADA